MIDGIIAIKWFIPEIHPEVALSPSRLQARLQVPDFIRLEVGSVLAKKIRHSELTEDEGDVILKEFRQLPLQYHPDQRLRKFFQAFPIGPLALESFGSKTSFDWNSGEGTAHFT